MKPEPLDLEININEVLKKYKYLTDVKRQIDFKDGFFHAIEVVKQRIKSACEFYLKYKDNPLLLIKDFPSYEKYVSNFVKNYTELKDKTLIKFGFKKYNEWLFKLSFKPVFEGGVGEKEG